MQYIRHDIDREIVFRISDDVQGGQRPRPHGIHIAECIGSGNLAVIIGIVNNRRKYIDGLNERTLPIQPEDTCVIGCVDTYQQVGMRDRRQFRDERA